MVLESPYYGRRRPRWQPGSRLLRVSDLLVLGRATIEEGLCLLELAKREGFSKLGTPSHLHSRNAAMRHEEMLSKLLRGGRKQESDSLPW